jgi:hypothetical protein
MMRKKKPQIIIAVSHRGRKNSRDHICIFFLSEKTPTRILGEQTRHSTIQLQKRIKEMTPKQGKKILSNIFSFI